MAKKDLYNLLGVSQTATEQEIREAYLKKKEQCALTNSNDDSELQKKCQRITEAYEILSDMDKRALYDIRGIKRKTSRVKTTNKVDTKKIKSVRNILNNLFLFGSAITVILFVVNIITGNSTPFYWACGVSLTLKITEYTLRLFS